jgi:broad specificity phosphatase PhoE
MKSFYNQTNDIIKSFNKTWENKNMLNIYIARHGQDEDNFKGILNGRRDKPLTKEGIKQAEFLGKKLAKLKIKFDKIYSSPLKRAFKTAKIISVNIDGPVPVIMEDLIERDFGIMSGKHHRDIIKLCSPKILQSEGVTYFLEPEGAETFPKLLVRGKKIVKMLKKENDSGNILIVTHGDIGKMIYAAFYNLDWQETLKEFYFGNADVLLLSEGFCSEEAQLLANVKK